MTSQPLALPAGAPPTYYDQPPLKPSVWGWKVSGYIFVGGLAGAAQILATAADLADRKKFSGIVRHGRYLAFAGAAAGGPLLIADLHTPQRFYNMLRIFRRTSPMSIGTYVLMSFGAASAVLAVVQFARDRGRDGAALALVVRTVEIPAAISGAAMTTYTGALLAATSTPLWAAAALLLPALFGASAMAAAAAALSLGQNEQNRRPLDRIGLAAGLVELGLHAALRRRWRTAGVDGALRASRWGLAHDLGGGARGAAVPSAGHALGAIVANRPRPLLPFVAVATLAGSLALRHVLLRAGNLSATRPNDYFRFTRPRESAA
jgi:protein NrfD